MGRYFSYRMHPFSVAETVSRELPDPARVVRPPGAVEAAGFEALRPRSESVLWPAIERDQNLDHRKTVLTKMRWHR